MAETISGELPAWLVQKTFLNSNAVSQELQAGLQYAQQQKQLAQHQQALALQQQAFQLKRDAELDVAQGLVEVGQVVSEIAKTGDWTAPENKARFYEAAAKHPHVMKSPAFKSLEENFQLADKAKATEALWSNRLETQEDIARARIEAQLQAQQNKLDTMLQMEGMKEDFRKELETHKSELRIIQDSLKPTRTGQLVHDLPETDLVQMRSELSSVDKKYDNGEFKNVAEYDAAKQAVLKKYDAKRVGTPKPSQPASTAPQASFPTAPPMDQRQAGQIYQTPKGPYKWNGQGWEQP